MAVLLGLAERGLPRTVGVGDSSIDGGATVSTVRIGAGAGCSIVGVGVSVGNVVAVGVSVVVGVSDGKGVLVTAGVSVGVEVLVEKSTREAVWTGAERSRASATMLATPRQYTQETPKKRTTTIRRDGLGRSQNSRHQSRKPLKA